MRVCVTDCANCVTLRNALHQMADSVLVTDPDQTLHQLADRNPERAGDLEKCGGPGLSLARLDAADVFSVDPGDAGHLFLGQAKLISPRPDPASDGVLDRLELPCRIHIRRSTLSRLVPPRTERLI